MGPLSGAAGLLWAAPPLPAGPVDGPFSGVAGAGFPVPSGTGRLLRSFAAIDPCLAVVGVCRGWSPSREHMGPSALQLVGSLFHQVVPSRVDGRRCRIAPGGVHGGLFASPLGAPTLFSGVQSLGASRPWSSAADVSSSPTMVGPEVCSPFSGSLLPVPSAGGSLVVIVVPWGGSLRIAVAPGLTPWCSSLFRPPRCPLSSLRPDLPGCRVL